MDFKSKITSELIKVFGNTESYLEEIYFNKIIKILHNKNITECEDWLTYNQLIIEIRKNPTQHIQLNELLYRLTDIEDPTNVCIEVIKNLNDITPEIERLHKKILNFK